MYKYCPLYKLYLTRTASLNVASGAFPAKKMQVGLLEYLFVCCSLKGLTEIPYSTAWSNKVVNLNFTEFIFYKAS